MGSKIVSKHNLLVIENPISTDTVSDTICLENYEPRYAVQVNWENGLTVDMDLSLEVSLDRKSFVELPSTVNITDTSGTHIWDIPDSSVEYIRLKVKVTTGSAEFSGQLNGKQRV